MKAQIVSFHCIVKNQLGRVISSTFNNDVITQPGENSEYLQGLIEGLQDLQKGEKRRIVLPAKKAYGYYDPSKVVELSREEITTPLKRGDQVMMKRNGKEQQLRVIAIDDERVVLDGNHPLAGQDLIFEIEATQARDATREEMLSTFEPEFESGGSLLH